MDGERAVERAGRIWDAERRTFGEVGDWVRNEREAASIGEWRDGGGSGQAGYERECEREREHGDGAGGNAHAMQWKFRYWDSGEWECELRDGGRGAIGRDGATGGHCELRAVLVRHDLPLSQGDRQQRTSSPTGIDERVQQRRAWHECGERAGGAERDDPAGLAGVQQLQQFERVGLLW